jgi:hypothetical protein
MPDAPRPFEERKQHALELLGAPAADAWVATGSTDAPGYLVPLSIGWTGTAIALVTERRSLTARNLASNGAARLAVGGTRDVAIVDTTLVGTYALTDPAAAPLLDVFAAQSDWDPRGSAHVDAYAVYQLRPQRIQAWREANELAGRTLMRDGAWLEVERPNGPDAG